MRAARRSATADAMALGVSRPGPHAQAQERQAEQAADQIMAGRRATPGGMAPGPYSPGAGAIQPPQAKAAAGAAVHGAPNAASVAAGQGGGMPLPTASRALFEPGLGASLGDVRLHTDASAARSAAALNARAFTRGSDVTFAAGQFQPDTRQGKHLLAHELAHVVQQRQSGVPRVQRRGWGDLFGPPDPKADCADELQDAEDWARDGPYPADPLAMVGALGFGGFSAQYRADPAQGNGLLQISEAVAVIFKDTLVLAGGVVSPHPDLPHSDAMGALATRINTIADAAQRSTAMAAFQWSPAEKEPWITQLEPLIEQKWGGQHDFFLNQPRWDWLGASVAVDLDIGERAKRPTDHMDLETYKTPAGESLRTYDISHGVTSGSKTNAFDQSMRLASTTLGPKEVDLLGESVQFALNSATLTPAATATLDGFVSTFDGAFPGGVAHAAHQEIHVDIIGHASASGEEDYNQTLSEQRAAAVRDYLRDHGFHNVELRVQLAGRGEREADQSDPTRASDQRVDLRVDGGQRMITAVHEFGHAWGVDDEYGTVGETVDHDAWAKDMTDASGAHLPGAVREHNGGIMSFGNEVRPRHYATFHHALQTVTAKSPWSLGLHKAKWQVQMECGAPSPPGDWNVPKRDDPTRIA